MSRKGLEGPENGLQSVMFHRQLLLTHAPSSKSPITVPDASRVGGGSARARPGQCPGFRSIFSCCESRAGAERAPDGGAWAYAAVVAASSLVQNAHLVAATGTFDWQYGQLFVGGGSPKTTVPRRLM